jgi:hypothetical protein
LAEGWGDEYPFLVKYDTVKGEEVIAELEEFLQGWREVLAVVGEALVNDGG